MGPPTHLSTSPALSPLLPQPPLTVIFSQDLHSPLPRVLNILSSSALLAARGQHFKAPLDPGLVESLLSLFMTLKIESEPQPGCRAHGDLIRLQAAALPGHSLPAHQSRIPPSQCPPGAFHWGPASALREPYTRPRYSHPLLPCTLQKAQCQWKTLLGCECVRQAVSPRDERQSTCG